ncbi:MAG: tRNA 2-thiocytidine(32) synthetase TtcA [Desulfamplus sp.]|nr:tRNA 2-thiocytidine(32) synthetase TtcA [Desulfamplus sp.]
MMGSLKKLSHFTGRAIHDYSMIDDRDSILVAVSGGEDSLAMLELLFLLQKRAPVRFKLFPVHVDPGFGGDMSASLEYYIKGRYGNLLVDYTHHGVIAHSTKNRENPCFLCSRLRRKRLFEIARDLGCSKIAMGHHKDDIIETLFINMCYSGRMGTMTPYQKFFGGEITVIRPLAYADKRDIKKFAVTQGFPELINPCPSDGFTKRSQVRALLNELYKTNRNIKGNLFRAMSNVQIDYLLRQTI